MTSLTTGSNNNHALYVTAGTEQQQHKEVTTKLRRILIDNKDNEDVVEEDCIDHHRHCDKPHNYNVFDRKDSIEDDVPVCTSDSNGNYVALNFRMNSTLSTSSNSSSTNVTSSVNDNDEEEGKDTHDITPTIIDMIETQLEQDSVVVAYQYQIQTTSNQVASTLRTNYRGALVQIEKAISDVLVTNLFDPSHCNNNNNNNTSIISISDSQSNNTSTSSTTTTSKLNNRTTNTERQTEEKSDDGSSKNTSSSSLSINNKKNQIEPTSTLIGISAAPKDEILPGLIGVSCLTPLQVDADRCYRIGGYLTLYGIGNNISSWAPEISVHFIQTAMNNGYFNTIHPDVKSVQFIAVGPYVSPTDANSNRTNIVHEDPYGSSVGGGSTGTTNTGTKPGNYYPDPSLATTKTYNKAWPWIISSMGFGLLLIGSLVIYYRRRRYFKDLRQRTYHEIGTTNIVTNSSLKLSNHTKNVTTSWAQISNHNNHYHYMVNNYNNKKSINTNNSTDDQLDTSEYETSANIYTMILEDDLREQQNQEEMSHTMIITTTTSGGGLDRHNTITPLGSIHSLIEPPAIPYEYINDTIMYLSSPSSRSSVLENNTVGTGSTGNRTNTYTNTNHTPEYHEQQQQQQQQQLDPLFAASSDGAESFFEDSTSSVSTTETPPPPPMGSTGAGSNHFPRKPTGSFPKW